jgi:hypothetical protein
MAADTFPPSGRGQGAETPVGSHPYAPRPFVVRERIQETGDTVTLKLAPRSGEDRFPFHGGQFNMVYVFGVGESAISISGDPNRPGELVHTVRQVGKVTNAIAALTPGSVVGIRGPYGRGWPLDSARGRDIVIVAASGTRSEGSRSSTEPEPRRTSSSTTRFRPGVSGPTFGSRPRSTPPDAIGTATWGSSRHDYRIVGSIPPRRPRSSAAPRS